MIFGSVVITSIVTSWFKILFKKLYKKKNTACLFLCMGQITSKLKHYKGNSDMKAVTHMISKYLHKGELYKLLDMLG